MITFILIVGPVMALVTTSFVVGRSPLTLLIRAGFRLQGELLWLRWQAWPAVLRERHPVHVQYWVDEARRRAYEPVQHARKSAEEKTFAPPPAPPSPGFWSQLRKSVEA